MRKVSIITPLYNSEEFVSEMIMSVKQQDYQNWELIFVDDCSTDKSVAIVNRFMINDDRIVLLRNTENLGAGPSRNKAIKHATGSMIAFLDSDDIWHPKKLSTHLEYMRNNSASFSHTSYGFINEKGDEIKTTYKVNNHPVGYYDLLKRTEISCLTAMYDVESIGKMYMPDLRKKQDYALWLDILKTGVVSHGLDKELAFYRQRKGSTTSKKSKLFIDHWRFLRNREEISFMPALYYLFLWSFGGFIKYYVK